jgi:post-segregation antitoxin (ccd killing protein)
MLEVIMANVTLSINDDLIEKGRIYAHDVKGTTLSALIRELLEKEVVRQEKVQWLEECFLLMDKTGGDSGGKRWKREDLYRV